MRYKHILSFYKTNRHGAQVYLDPNEEYAIRIDDHGIEFEEEVRGEKKEKCTWIEMELSIYKSKTLT
ncbi:hypothetical protein DD599_25955 [Enterobacter cloacae complex sp. CH23B]|nr:hypothetical protein DD599_25955 [Enterobacter cloacae complex sp. CH23B]